MSPIILLSCSSHLIKLAACVCVNDNESSAQDEAHLIANSLQKPDLRQVIK